MAAKAAAAPPRTSFVQSNRKRGRVGDAPGWPDAGENSCAERDQTGVKQRHRVDPCFLEAWNVWRTKRDDNIEAPNSEEHPGGRAKEREQDTFRQKLTSQSPAAPPPRAAGGQ